MSGSLPPGAVFPGVASPVQPPSPGLAALSDEGPLHFTARALQARLQTVFPATRFDFQFLDGKIGKTQWKRVTRRPPAIGVGWAGVKAGDWNGEQFGGISQWFVMLLVSNESGPGQRLLGDRASPGLLAMVRAATLALQGFTIANPDTGWAASGTVQVTSVAALYSDDWTDDAYALAGLELDVAYQETLIPGQDTINNMDALAIDWRFAASPGTSQFSDIVELAGP